MVSAITCTRSAELIGVHRTFLDHKLCAKATISPPRMVLGNKRGGVIRLIPDEDISRRLALAEGIETALSAVSAGWPCWSAIDAGNMASFPIWPGTDLTVFADHDDAGLQAAEKLAARWQGAGGAANIIAPDRQGEDWNDEAQRLSVSR